MTLANKLVLFFLVFLNIACSKKNNNCNLFKIDQNIPTYELFNLLDLYKLQNIKPGINNIKIINTPLDEYIKFDDCASDMSYSYIVDDSICNSFMFYNGWIRLNIQSGYYQVNLEYYSPGISPYTPSIKQTKLILNKGKYQIGDTIIGQLFIETNKFDYKNNSRADLYFGSFMNIILTKEEFDRIPKIGFL